MYCPHHLQMLINLAWCCPHHLQKSVSMIQKIQSEVPLFVHMGCVNDSEETLRKRRVLSTSVGRYGPSLEIAFQGSAPFPLAPTIITSATELSADLKIVGAIVNGADPWHIFFPLWSSLVRSKIASQVADTLSLHKFLQHLLCILQSN